MGSGPQLYDPSKYGGNAVPASGAAAGIGDATRAIQSYQDASKSRGGKPSLFQRIEKRLGGGDQGGGGGRETPVDPDAPSTIPSRKRGGFIRKTQVVRLHKGEHVLTAKQVDKIRKTRKVRRKTR